MEEDEGSDVDITQDITIVGDWTAEKERLRISLRIFMYHDSDRVRHAILLVNITYSITKHLVTKRLVLIFSHLICGLLTEPHFNMVPPGFMSAAYSCPSAGPSYDLLRFTAVFHPQVPNAVVTQSFAFAHFVMWLGWASDVIRRIFDSLMFVTTLFSTVHRARAFSPLLHTFAPHLCSTTPMRTRAYARLPHPPLQQGG